MCGRYAIGKAVPGEFDVRFGGQIDIGALGRYNVAPTEAVAVVRGAADGAADVDARRSANAHWGLMPPWATSRKERLKPINARVESLAEKRMFAPLVAEARHRVLVPADGWYEWLRGEDPKQARVPFHHTVDDGGPFAFAGLARTVRLRDANGDWTDPAGRAYSAARSPDGDGTLLLTVTLVTCAANATASRLHDRMPAVLAGPNEEAAWLSPEVGAEAAVGLCVPLDDARLRIAPASPLVNDVRSADGPWLLDPDVAVEPGGSDDRAGGRRGAGLHASARQTSLDLRDRPDA